MKNCPNCGRTNDDDNRFCYHCSHEFGSNQPNMASSHLRGNMGGVRFGNDLHASPHDRTHNDPPATSESWSTNGDTYTSQRGSTSAPSHTGNPWSKYWYIVAITVVVLIAAMVMLNGGNPISEAPADTVENDAYWCLHTGSGLDSNYELHFLPNGTYEGYSHQGKYITGIYSYDDQNGFLHLGNDVYQPDGDGYKSLDSGGLTEEENRTLSPSTSTKYKSYTTNESRSSPTSAPVRTPASNTDPTTSPVPTQTPKPDSTPKKDTDTVKTGTYWLLHTGYGPGYNYELHFLSGGKYDGYSRNGDYIEGTYRYDEQNDILYLDNDAYQPDGDGYISLDLFLFMGGPMEGEYRTLVPSTISNYNYSKNKEFESLFAPTDAPTSTPAPTKTPAPTATPTATAAPPDAPVSSMSDGKHGVVLFSDSFYEKDGYLCAEAWITELIYLSEEYVYSLEAGDTIDLSEYGRDDIPIADIEYQQFLGGICGIWITQGENMITYTLYPDPDSGYWYIAENAGGGAPLTYFSGSEELVFSPDVYSHENINGFYRDFDSPEDASFGEMLDSYMSADVVIDDGLVTEIFYELYG